MTKGCNNCQHKQKIIMRVGRCFLYGCEVLGEVPFWTNSENTLNKTDCKKWESDKDPKQLLFDF